MERQVVRIALPQVLWTDEALLDERRDNLLVRAALHKKQLRNNLSGFKRRPKKASKAWPVWFHEAVASPAIRAHRRGGSAHRTRSVKPVETADQRRLPYTWFGDASTPDGAPQAPWYFVGTALCGALYAQFVVRNLDGFGCVDQSVAVAVAGCLLQYVKVWIDGSRNKLLETVNE